jgi:hypothetical protein
MLVMLTRPPARAPPTHTPTHIHTPTHAHTAPHPQGMENVLPGQGPQFCAAAEEAGHRAHSRHDCKVRRCVRVCHTVCVGFWPWHVDASTVHQHLPAALSVCAGAPNQPWLAWGMFAPPQQQPAHAAARTHTRTEHTQSTHRAHTHTHTLGTHTHTLSTHTRTLTHTHTTVARGAARSSRPTTSTRWAPPWPAATCTPS